MAEAAELIEAIEAGDRERVRALVEAEPALAHAEGANGVSAPLLALYRGDEASAVLLADAKGELDVFEAAALGRVERLRELLDEDPGRAHAWTQDGFTALHYAAFFDGPEAAGALVEGGADANALARNEQLQVMPIHSAAASKQAEIVRLLLAHGADPNARQGSGFTPLHAAGQNGDEETADVLLGAGADRTVRHPDGRTAADFAREAGHADLAARLAEPR